MIVSNSSRKSKFFNSFSLEIHDDWKTLVSNIQFSSNSFENHIYNCSINSAAPNLMKEVILGIYLIPPRSFWDYDGKRLNLIKLNDEVNDVAIKIFTIDDFIYRFKKTFTQFKEQIAVELSGGLDTSILIGLLKAADIEPLLIGAVSERYEFRTERFIQTKISNDFQRVHLINEMECLPFSSLTLVPPHLLPNKASLFFKPNLETNKIAKSNNIKILLNGIGMDMLLTETVNRSNYNNKFININLYEPWANDNIFMPDGIYYFNAATLKSFKEGLLSNRFFLNEDYKKKWARNFFIDVIPSELNNFQYKANFSGVNYQGYVDNEEEIIEVCREAYYISNLATLKIDQVRSAFAGTLDLCIDSEKKLLSILSYAVWIYGLRQNALI